MQLVLVHREKTGFTVGLATFATALAIVVPLSLGRAAVFMVKAFLDFG
jgi:hypothetical protein